MPPLWKDDTLMDSDTMDGIKSAWEAAAQLHPTGEPHCLIIGVRDMPHPEWTVLAYTEITNVATLVDIAAHAMSHLSHEPKPLWIAHAGVAFVITDPALVGNYKGGGLQAAAEAGDDNVREVLTINLIDDDGMVSQHYSRPLNERLGSEMRGRHVGYVTDVLTAMWTAVSGRRV